MRIPSLRTRFLATLAAATSLLQAMEPGGHPGILSFRSYGLEQGLQNVAVWSLLQDQEGFVWVGTEDRLYRYAGGRFDSFGLEEGLPSTYIQSLLQTPNGSLWVGTHRGLAVLRQGRFQCLGEASGLPSVQTTALVLDSDRRLWVATPRGPFVQTDPDHFLRAPGWPGGETTHLCALKEGGLLGIAWNGMRSHVLRWDGRAWHPLQGDFEGERLLAVAQDGGGHLWARSLAGLWRLSPGERVFRPWRPGIPPARQHARLHVDGAGRLWATTEAGLYRWDGEQPTRLGPQEGFPDITVRALLVDREGTLWLGGEGIHRLQGGGVWRAYTPSLGIPRRFVWSIFRDRGGQLYVGTDGGLARATPQGWVAVPGTGHLQVRTIVQGPEGHLFLAGGPEILRLDPRTGVIARYRAESGVLTGGRIYRLLFDRTGTLWVATIGGGLLRGERVGDGWRFRRVDLPGGSPVESVEDLYEDAEGRIWAPGEGGLSVLDGGIWRRFTSADGLRENEVARARGTRDGDMLLVYFSPRGVARARLEQGRLRILEHLDDVIPPGRILYLIGEDARGNLWVGGAAGVDLITPRREVEHFTRADGLVGDNTNNMAFLADPDGDVWIGTTAGLARFDSAAYRGAPPPPVTRILSVRIGNSGEMEAPRQGVEIPWKANSFEARFAAMSYIREAAVQYQVRLEGLEPEWRPSERSPERFPMLPSGRYTFQVRARTGLGHWGPIEALSFTVIPPWWRTWWFILSMGLGLGGLVVLAVRLRLAALKRANEELERKVRDRTAELGHALEDLRVARDEALQATQAKSFFLATMSHEIRTPLNGVIGMSAMLLDSDLPPLQKDFVGTIHGSSENLLAIVNDILDFSKVEAGRLELESVPFDPVHEAEECLGVLAEPIQRKGIELVGLFDPSLKGGVVGDPARLRQVLVNLIGNAAKFTPGGGTVTLRGRATEAGEGRVMLRFEVQDTGIGIPAESLPRIFAPYEQAEKSTTRQYGGTGLGLAICKRFVEAMEGRIGAESEAGSGSCFWFEIPFERVPQTPEGLGDFPDGTRVLLLCPHPDLRASLAQTLAAWKVRADVVDTWEAMERELQTDREHFSALLLDTASGDVLTLGRRACGVAGRGLPVVLLVSVDALVGAEEARKLLGLLYVTKPVRRARLHQTLRRCLGMESQELESPLAPCPVEPGRHRGRVLVVDDNETNRKVARLTLQGLGFEPTLAASGEEALARLAEDSFDAVLMDCNMPEMDGFETTRRIRAQEGKARHTVILALTAHSVIRARERCFEAGMDGYLTKPLRREPLNAALSRWIECPGGRGPEETPTAPLPPLEDSEAPGLLDEATWAGLEYLEATTGAGAVAELVGDYAQDVPGRLQRMKEALLAGDLERLSRLAHDLKSNSATLGARRVAEAAERVEHLAAEGRREALPDLLEQLRGETDQAITALRTRLE